jgi:hypothetical protein
MATQNTTTTGGQISISASVLLFTWSDVRNSSTGNSVSVNPSNSLVGAYTISSGRGSTYNIFRTYLAFDLSSVVGTITSMDLVLTSNASVYSSNLIILKSTAPEISTNITTSDFGDVDFSTEYSDSFGWDESTTISIQLNNTAISDSNTNDELILGVVDYEYDYLNIEPLGAFIGLTASMQYSTGTTPYLSYTATTQYGNKVTGIIPANISKVNGVATANIETMIGV